MLFNLSLSLSLSLRFSKALEFRELFSPTQEEKKIISSNRILYRAPDEKRETRKSLSSPRACVRASSKILFFSRGDQNNLFSSSHETKHKKTKQKNKKDFPSSKSFVDGGHSGRERRTFKFCVCRVQFFLSALHRVCATRG